MKIIDTIEKARELDRSMGFVPTGPAEAMFRRAAETPPRVYRVPVEVSGLPVEELPPGVRAEPNQFLEVATRAMFVRLQIRERELRREFGAELLEWAEQNIPEELP